MEDIEKEEYMCPLTLNYMKDPVLASDGNIYEKDAIIKWYNTDKNKLSPLNREKLKYFFVQQDELRNEINKFMNDNNITIDDIDPIFNSKTIYKIKIPYAFKLLVQELMSMKIAPKFVLED